MPQHPAQITQPTHLQGKAPIALLEQSDLPWWIAMVLASMVISLLLYRQSQFRTQLQRSRQVCWNLQTIIAHEIRTPLCAISKLLELCQNRYPRDAASELLQAARDSARSMLELLDDMLTRSKLDAGQLALNPQPADLPDLIGELRRIYSPIATQKRLNFVIQSDCHPQLLMFDKLRLRQILSNLLSNAIKFTQQGQICLRVSSRPATSGKAHVDIQVSDTGIGIPRHTLQEMFKPFGAAGEQARQQFGGNGLGLYLCEQLTKRMNGAIHADSQPGRGTRITLEFVFDMTTTPTAQPTNITKAAYPPYAGFRALVAEDDQANQMLLRHQLEQQGMTVHCCGNGEQALQRWAHEPFDILFCDMHMPQLNGLELTKRIRRLERRLEKGHLPIIGISGDLSAPLAGCGVDYCLGKPVTASELQRGLMKCLGPAPRAPADVPLRLEALHQLSQGDPVFEQDFIRTVLQNNQSDLEKLKTAQEKGDRTVMAEAVHRLQSAIRLLCTDKLADQCRDLEKELRTHGPMHTLQHRMNSMSKEIHQVNKALRRLLEP
jgi:CheY-like chemotaxis protein